MFATFADLDSSCDVYPCTNGAGTASCQNLPSPDGSPISVDGRACSCGGGFNYMNDTVGCMGKVAFAAFNAGSHRFDALAWRKAALTLLHCTRRCECLCSTPLHQREWGSDL
jgi:hypothetical protein